jgi:2-keto-4-pentenoate hydratase/2-oxohepta-3-ene-1,7-dioic acid hydratase in catechol pathway
MRLVTFVPKKGAAPRVGVLHGGNHVLDVTHAARNAPFDPHDMLSLIAAGPKGLAWVKKLAAQARNPVPLGKVKLLAPIPRPRKNVFCVGWNYVEHFEEGKHGRAAGVEYPAHPAFFSKAPGTVIGPYDPVPLHAGVTEKLDWEVELGVIIGKGGANILEASALNHVYGYTAINDVSAREVQRQHGQQWFKGKSLDGTFMYFKVPRIIAELSAGLTLEPGDIISTGTPAGVGHARTPPEFMKAGDVLETEVEGIGLLRNRIGR